MLDLGKVEKAARATAIREYMAQAGYARAVCFSCGNAYSALLEEGVDVLGVAPNGDFMACRWFRPSEIRRIFPDYFDATSGHLPMELIYTIASALKSKITLNSGGQYEVLSGSGETALCLKIAFPGAHIVPVFDNSNPATEWNAENLLNPLLGVLFNEIKILGKE